MRDAQAPYIVSPGLLFYPQVPYPRTTLTRICAYLGYRVVTDLTDPFDLAIFWTTSTLRRRDATLAGIGRRSRVLNIACTDIGKRRVDRAFRSVFGYASLVDPLTGSGPCVRKSNRNAQHDGVVLQRPLTRRDGRFVYQRVINNVVDASTCEDLRTPVIGGEIPFVYVVRKPLATRFEDIDATWPVETHEVFSSHEVSSLLEFCRAMGLDCAELDVLRDRDEGRIYIVDANPTPWTPEAISPEDFDVALDRMAGAFDRLARCHERHGRAEGAAGQSPSRAMKASERA